MQIHELNSFVGTPSAGDYLAIDDGSETTKVEASNLGVTTQMTQAEAEAGTVTESRVVAPSIFKTAVTAIASAISGVFVSMTTPKYTIDTSAASGDDYDLTQALTSLGWLSDVVTSGVLVGKKLLYKVLNRLSGVEGFALTSSPSGFAGRGAYDKAINTVRITIRGASTSNVSSSTVLGYVPSAYRPSTSRYGDALCITPSSYLGANLLVESNGNVTQTATNTMRAIFGYIEYTLD